MPLEHDQFWHMAAHQQQESGRSVINGLNSLTGQVTIAGANGLGVVADATTGVITLTEDTHVQTLTGLSGVITLSTGPGMSKTLTAQDIKLGIDTIAQQNVTGVGVTIGVTSSTTELTATGGYTLTSTPSVQTAGIVNGQKVLIFNGDAANTITLQDQGTLVGSGLRLFAATQAIPPRGSMQLMYSTTFTAWVQLSPIAAPL